MIDLSVRPVRATPFEHVVVENFLPADLYTQLRDRYPECKGVVGTRLSLFPGDPDYDALLASDPAWREAHDAFCSQAFLDYCRDQFAEVWAREGCAIDWAKARYVPFVEPREFKELRHIPDPKPDPHALFVRMDMLQGGSDYSLVPHLDHRRRLASLLMYFSDAAEARMEGGDFQLHRAENGAPGEVVDTIRPRQNLMIAFASSNRSFHSVSLVGETARAPRRFVQVQVSSSIDAWPFIGI